MSGSRTEQAQLLIKAVGKRRLAAARGDTRNEAKKGLPKQVLWATAVGGSRGAAEGGVGRVSGGEVGTLIQ